MVATTLETSYYPLEADNNNIIKRNGLFSEGGEKKKNDLDLDTDHSVVRLAVISNHTSCCRRHSFPSIDEWWFCSREKHSIRPMEDGALAIVHDLMPVQQQLEEDGLDNEVFQAMVREISIVRNDRPQWGFHYGLAFLVFLLYCPWYDLGDEDKDWVFYSLTAACGVAEIVHGRYVRRALELAIQIMIDDYWVHRFRDLGFHLRIVVEPASWGNTRNETYLEIWKMGAVELQQVSAPTEDATNQDNKEDYIVWVTAFAGFRRQRQPALRHWDASTNTNRNSKYPHPPPHRFGRLGAATYSQIMREAKELPCLQYRRILHGAGFFIGYLLFLTTIFLSKRAVLRDVFFYFTLSILPLYLLQELVLEVWWIPHQMHTKVVQWQDQLRLEGTGFTIEYRLEEEQCCCLRTGYLRFSDDILAPTAA